MAKENKRPYKLQIWIDARKKYHLTDAQIQMARELGLNPKKFGGYANHRQQRWKRPLGEYTEHLYFKRFGKIKPDRVISIEERAQEIGRKKREKRGNASDWDGNQKSSRLQRQRIKTLDNIKVSELKQAAKYTTQRPTQQNGALSTPLPPPCRGALSEFLLLPKPLHSHDHPTYTPPIPQTQKTPHPLHQPDSTAVSTTLPPAPPPPTLALSRFDHVHHPTRHPPLATRYPDPGRARSPVPLRPGSGQPLAPHAVQVALWVGLGVTDDGAESGQRPLGPRHGLLTEALKDLIQRIEVTGSWVIPAACPTSDYSAFDWPHSVLERCPIRPQTFVLV